MCQVDWFIVLCNWFSMNVRLPPVQFILELNPAYSLWENDESMMSTVTYHTHTHTGSTFCVCIQSTLLTQMKATDQQVWTFPNFQILKAPLKFLYSLWATETVKHLWPHSAGKRNFQGQSPSEALFLKEDRRMPWKKTFLFRV